MTLPAWGVEEFLREEREVYELKRPLGEQVALGVIGQALVDVKLLLEAHACGTSRQARKRARQTEREGREALRFLTSEEGEDAEQRAYWAGQAGLDPEALRQRVLTIVRRWAHGRLRQDDVVEASDVDFGNGAARRAA